MRNRNKTTVLSKSNQIPLAGTTTTPGLNYNPITLLSPFFIRKKLPIPIAEPLLTSGYGNRIIDGKTQFHFGVDYVNKPRNNTRIYAVDNMKTLDVYQTPSSGNTIEFIYESYPEYIIRFMHLHDLPIKRDYKKGEIIGNYGNTGFSRGAHLHIDVKKVGSSQFINPNEVFQIS